MVMAIGPTTMPLQAGVEPRCGLFLGRKGAGQGCLEHRLEDRVHLPRNPCFLQERVCLCSVLQPVKLNHESSLTCFGRPTTSKRELTMTKAWLYLRGEGPVAFLTGPNEGGHSP